MVKHWQTLLQSIIKSPQQRIAELALHSADELQQTLEEWNPRVTQYPETGCLHQLIEGHATRAPHAIALTLGTRQLTYEQLNTRANQLAHQLIEQGVGPEVMVDWLVKEAWRWSSVCWRFSRQAVPMCL